METVRIVLVVLHVGAVGLALLCLTVFVVRPRRTALRVAIAGVGSAILSGALLVAARDALDLATSAPKMGVKLGVAIAAAAALAWLIKRMGRPKASTALLPVWLAGALLVTDVVVAFAWS